MSVEDHKNMKKIQCWISLSTWQQLKDKGYNSPTIAVIEAFKKLLEDPHIIPNESPQDPEISPQNPRESPEIPVLKARLEEQEKLISFLKEALDKAGQREEDLKNMHNNYFLQVQTLINQKAIGSPQEAKGSKKEETSTADKATTTPKGDNDLIEKICKNCNQVFYTGNIKKETCSSKCRSAFNRKMKKD